MLMVYLNHLRVRSMECKETNRGVYRTGTRNRTVFVTFRIRHLNCDESVFTRMQAFFPIREEKHLRINYLLFGVLSGIVIL